MVSTSIGKVVPCDCRDYNVLEFHPANGFSNASGFINVHRKRFGRGDSTKSTRPRASFPRDHKGGGSLAPALPSIRALRRLAHRVKPKIGDKRFCRKEGGIGRQTDFDPLRLFRLMQRWVDFGAGHQTVKLMAGESKSNQGGTASVPSDQLFSIRLGRRKM